MEAFSKGVTEGQGKMLGLTTNKLFQIEKPDTDAYTDLIRYPDTPDRVAGFDKFSAYTIAMPGSEGTISEIANKAFNLSYEYFGQSPNSYQKQIILYDPKKEGFFNGLLQQEQRIMKQRQTAD